MDDSPRSSSRRRDSAAHVVEIAFWIVGVVLLVAAVAFVGSGYWFQRVASARLDEQLARADRQRQAIAVNSGDVIGRLEIPRLKLSVVVAFGDDNGTLRVAAGHLPDSPLPWDGGNSVIAAHRDSYFRPLQRIRKGDIVRLTTIRGVFEYTVTDSFIVKPDDLSVMERTDRPSLTLITCYPFQFVGTAPQRFIVRGERSLASAAGVATPVKSTVERRADRRPRAAAAAPSARRSAAAARTGAGKDRRPATAPRSGATPQRPPRRAADRPSL
jgi:sortase A